MNNDNSYMILAVAGGLLLLVVVAIGLIVWSAVVAPPAPATWDEWLTVHKQTCPTCRRAFDEADGAMCEEAFIRFQESIKAEQK